MKKSILLCVTDADFTGAPLYVNQLRNILSDQYVIDIVVAKNGKLLQGNELGFNKKSIFAFLDLISILRSFIIIKRKNPDAIWINSFKMSLIMRIGLILSGKSKIRVIYTVHGLSFSQVHSFRKSIIIWFEKIFARFVDNYIFLTQYDMNSFRNLVFKDINYTIIPNFSRLSVTDNIIARKEQCRTFVMIARNDPQKDYETLLNAFALIAKGRDVSLHCVGRGTKKLQDRVNKLEVQKKVFLHGESRNVYEFLRKADAFVLSTHYEGMPLVILEAMSMGLPIIATDVCGISEFVLNSSGLLVKPNSVEALQQAFLTMVDLSVKDFNDKRLLAYKNYEKKFSLTIFNDNIIQFLKRTIDGEFDKNK